MILCSEDEHEIDRIVHSLECQFEIKNLGEPKFCLGMRIKRDFNARTIDLDQEKYCSEILTRFGFEDIKPISTPMEVGLKFSSEEEKQLNLPVSSRHEPYREAVGALIYLSSCTRPDITMAVSIVSQFMANHTKEHWNAVKRIYRYLRGTVDFKLKLGRVKEEIEEPLIGYSDANWGGNEQDRRSTSGFCVFLYGSCVSWASKKQNCVTLSTMEAEYMSLALLTTEIIWFRSLLYELDLKLDGPTKIFEDNQSCIKVANNGSFAVKSKHISIEYRFVHEKIKMRAIKLEYCPTSEMIADILTEALSKNSFKKLRDRINIQ